MTLTEIKLTTNALNLLEDNITPEIIEACLDKYPFHESKQLRVWLLGIDCSKNEYEDRFQLMRNTFENLLDSFL